MLKHSMALWGIKEVAEIDPLIDLLIDVFAFEKAKLHHEIKASDTQLLHRLSRILMSNKWSSPMPSHGLMHIYPNEEPCALTTESQFYLNTSQYGKENSSIYFTPLVASPLHRACIRYKLYNTDIGLADLDNSDTKPFLGTENKIEDNHLWLGIAIEQDTLNKLDSLAITFLSEDVGLYPLLNTMSIHGENGIHINHQKTIFKPDELDETHYFNEIITYYTDCFYTLTLVHDAHVKKSIDELFPYAKKGVDGMDYEEKLFWVKIKLPEVFTKQKIKGLNAFLNVVPVVNRRRLYKQHNFKKNGRIVSLPSENDNFFLNIKSLQDDIGNYLKNILSHYNTNTNGTYSLYFGDLEKFDTRSAKVLVNKVSQAIREEGNAFAAMNPEKLNTYLTELVKQLDVLEQKAVEKIKEIDTIERSFLLTYPYPNATNYEIEYWTTNADLANGFNEEHIFNQYATNQFDMKKTRLLTKTVGGKIRKGEREQIDSLRYGLLTKERIVSVADVKSYIHQQIGNRILTIDVKPGAQISKDKKKGIIRTTDIIITLNSMFLSKLDLERLSFYLENELTSKSISNIPYQVIIQ
ncbi:hypothetical protein ACFFU9_05835 [Mariniflexile ostreae]|uniref:PDZ domain-containing protein n=1 Tax=Mariniflexile ostreae TaxID=1520892 RepID=A0ABV5F9X9_9FLAO